MSRTDFAESLKNCSVERQVEDCYNAALEKTLGVKKISYPHGCDGCCEFSVNGKKHTLLIEYKLDEDLSSQVQKAKVLAQVVFYLKRFESAGETLPGTVLVADKNECFVIHSNPLMKYLGWEIDWEKAPSMAGTVGELVLAISEDADINPFVYDVGRGFDFGIVAEKIKSVAEGTTSLIRITEHNVDRVFGIFSKKVVSEKEIGPNEMVALFISAVTGDEETFLHPSKKNRLVYKGKNVRVDSKKYEAFCGHFSTKCSPKEKMRLVEISDRLIEDMNRRKKGEFYTPTVWTDYAHRRMEKVLGENWRDEYVVYDCCCGCKNLTRDYNFKELYCSTLEQAELDLCEKYNPPRDRSFQFDFLNDELKRISEGGKVPDGLMDALENKKKIVFFINPPYGKPSGRSYSGKKMLSSVQSKMVEDGMGLAGSCLYGEFLYRIMSIKKQYGVDVSIGLFCNPTFMTMSGFKEFRKKFLFEFKYEDGFLFNAGHFADTASSWGINFTIWTSGETTDKNNFKHDLADTDENGEIVKVGEKTLYNVDGMHRMSDWCNVKVKTNRKVPLFSNAIKMTNKEVLLSPDSIGYYLSHSNSIMQNAQCVGMGSTVVVKRVGTEIFPSTNFLRCTCAFTARKLIAGNWINDKDEYLAPNEAHPDFHRFEMDSVVYSLFHSSSQQSSLRNVSYKGKLWDIKNEFFFMSKNEIEELADQFGLEETFNQARVAKESFVHNFLTGHGSELSPLATEVLEAGKELVRKSFKYRKLFDEEHPEYQILNADAGWYQVKALLKQFMPDELKKFRELYKKFSGELLPLIYELNFLKK